MMRHMATDVIVDDEMHHNPTDYICQKNQRSIAILRHQHIEADEIDGKHKKRDITQWEERPVRMSL
jgi:hypothetical protein